MNDVKNFVNSRAYEQIGERMIEDFLHDCRKIDPHDAQKALGLVNAINAYLAYCERLEALAMDDTVREINERAGRVI